MHKKKKLKLDKCRKTYLAITASTKSNIEKKDAVLNVFSKHLNYWEEMIIFINKIMNLYVRSEDILIKQQYAIIDDPI